MGTRLCCQRFDRLKVEVIVEMQVVHVLAVDEQVEHVVTLTANLQPRLYPVELRDMKEFGVAQCRKQILALQSFRWSLM